MRCAILGCNSDNQSKKNPLNKNIKFHRFPKNIDLCKQWLHATKKKDNINVKTAAVCSKHFLDCDYKINLKHRLLNYSPKCYRGLKDDAVPKLLQTQVSSVPSTSEEKTQLAEHKTQLNNILLVSRDKVKEEPPKIADNGGGGSIISPKCYRGLKDNPMPNLLQTQVSSVPSTSGHNCILLGKKRQKAQLTEHKAQIIKNALLASKDTVKEEPPKIADNEGGGNSISPKCYHELKDDAVPSLVQTQVSSVPSTSGHNPKILGKKRQKAQLTEHKAQIIKTTLLASKDTVKKEPPQIADNGGGDNNLMEACSSSDKGVQTNQVNLDYEDLQQKLENQTKEIKELKNQLDGVKKFFSKNQINKLNNQKRIKWSVNEISSAITMYFAGPRAYRLSLKKGYPYPAVSTLKEWLRKKQIEQGILKNALTIAEFADMSEHDRVCTIMFEKMKIRKEYLYDQPNDYEMQSYDFVQVAMISGVFKAWKQPIFFYFDCTMTSSLLMEIINFVEDSGFHVVAMVSDLSGANRGLHDDLHISESKPYFQNPSTKEKIFVMADVPHLLKLIRNNFVDHGFLIDGKVIKKKIVEQAINSGNVKITQNMTLQELNCAGPQRQKVKFAEKLFSHTLSCALSRFGTLGFLTEENWAECVDFFKLVNEWFNILNVSTPISDPHGRAFGLALDIQMPILDKMSQVISQMKVIGRSSQLPFQKGILISNSALKMLHVELKRRFGVDYILTRRLNLDVLENFFGVIRAKGGLHDHPTPLEFKHRLRSYILGRNEEAYSDF
ncbi:unnamed protein product [Brassicogethes aeneus]|uniref:THAP-type domain-containing protein n=1 Tax=Brassicogethes aeneus TaxID=1431903 RepID=A0A9P0AR25_BRAAE|nr:unnamed protein product [Brassicogethes aeneus]